MGPALPIKFHPQFGSIVCVSFEPGFKSPEMVKRRLCVVFSKSMGGRENLVTVVPLSTTPPKPIRPYHTEIDIPFPLPEPWGAHPRWVKGDMIYSVGFHRVELLRLPKGPEGREYQKQVLPSDVLIKIQKCVLHGMGMSSLVKHLPS